MTGGTGAGTRTVTTSTSTSTSTSTPGIPSGRGGRRSTVHTLSGHRLGAADPRQEGPTDLRLVPPALAAWAAAALGVGTTGRTAALAAVACGVAGALLAVLSRRRAATAPGTVGRPPFRRGVFGAAAMTLLCAAAAATSAALHAADVHRGPVPELAAEYAHATAELTVTGDPHTTHPQVRGARREEGVIVVPAEIRRVTADGVGTVAVRAPVLLLVHPQERDGPAGPAAGADSGGDGDGDGGSDGADRNGDAGSRPPAAGSAEGAWRGLLPSARVRVEARLAPAQGAGRGGRDIAAVLRAQGTRPPEVIGRPSALQRTAGDLRAGLREASDGLAPDPRALLPGLVVGDTARIPHDLDQAFRTTDMLHLLAVSGGNLTVLLVLLIGPPGTASRAERRGLAPRLGIPLRTTAVLGALLTLAFVVVSRPDPSVLRAATCGLITILAIGTGRRRSLLPALAAAVLVLVLWDPWLARDFGFLLSVLATGSLLTVAPRWGAALRRRGVPGRLAEALAAAAAAQAACAPVVAVLSAHVSLVAVPCNLLAEFAVAPATVLGFAALAAAPFGLPVAKALAWLAGWPAGAIALTARTGALLPGAVVDWPGSWTGAALLAVLVLALAVLARRLPRHPLVAAACALLLLLALVRPPSVTRPLTGWPPPDWRLVACDVGQGDALALSAGDGSAVLIDTGPDPDAVDRCLRALGIRSIPLLLLTHFHADHVSGLSGALRGRAVGSIQTTGLQEPRDQAEFVHRTARQAGIPEIRAAPGERRAVGGLSWEVLWPDREAPPRTPGESGSGGSGGESGANDSSVTLLVRAGDLTVFLPGDLEPPAQRRLLAAHPDLPRVDVLKVAHHGSAYQHPALLERLRPRTALISSGEDNPYGHPSPRTLDALRRQGALVLRTDLSGALAVTDSGAGVVRRPPAAGP
ncbi:MBL fold metallo-hydrolase [Streptomyces armeniacus]|uniref:MBL fold metallo-hydrolase n=1 Tax=Streptomyces armeniacus TaxID=83291 RepID=A0A345XPY2_9ACTN|nr:ComEC/Rec2 family competence protein [Streptomyces armeniacus]AXK33698.1 MBL fold metallo-hydrolase [Streptomyces armeniacus]